ncbi:hypothetical protein XA68_14810 [Ophiocordyceps unilateralis]|uniref:Uncharacterized protein n=1 Tax=Ophiocordyceps unilateralis TaxID=268505 RepID=A0A2A9P8F2_OPHUN|nr:hypothetical protein XA68_14810 [Ophiocordyceps unilateralis]
MVASTSPSFAPYMLSQHAREFRRRISIGEAQERPLFLQHSLVHLRARKSAKQRRRKRKRDTGTPLFNLGRFESSLCATMTSARARATGRYYGPSLTPGGARKAFVLDSRGHEHLSRWRRTHHDKPSRTGACCFYETRKKHRATFPRRRALISC